MGRPRKNQIATNAKLPPPTSVEAEQNQLVSKAMMLASKQMDEGTASPSVIVHFLKLGTITAELELENIKAQNRLLDAKVEQIANAESLQQMYADALKAMSSYTGHAEPEEEDEYY